MAKNDQIVSWLKDTNDQASWSSLLAGVGRLSGGLNEGRSLPLSPRKLCRSPCYAFITIICVNYVNDSSMNKHDVK
jgi:hypothetical protein